MTNRFIGTNSFGRVRQAAVLLVATAVAGAGLAVVLGRSDQAAPVYTSRSLMVANEWQQRIEGVGRLANAIVETGAFERRLLETDPTAFANTQVRSTFDVVAVLDTVAVWVEAEAPSAELAERRANAAAETLAAELNRLGEGTGKFSIQDPASPAQPRTARQFSAPERAAVGGLAALLLATGAVLAWPSRRVVQRSPVTDELEDGDAGEPHASADRQVAARDLNVVWIPLPLDTAGHVSETQPAPDATQGYPWGQRTTKKLQRPDNVRERGA